MTGPKRVTEKQLAANRANALRSTGPRTPEGKAVARYNALTHGILARAVIPEALEPYESREAFDALLNTLRDEFAPANTMEDLLVEQIATAYWRLARLYRAEAGSIAKRQDAVQQDLARESMLDAVTASLGNLEGHDEPQVGVGQLESAMANKRSLRALMLRYDESLREASDEQVRVAAERLLASLHERLAQQERHRQAIEAAERSLPYLGAALQYARYETALQNQLDRALSRLERLQRLRSGEAVPPPIQVNVEGPTEAAGTDDDPQTDGA